MMQCLVTQAAVRFADTPALIDPLQTVSYREFDLIVARTAQRLKEHGIGPASRVGIVLPSSIDQIILLMALIRLRAVACPISSRLPQAGVEACLQKVGAELLITGSKSLRISTCRTLDASDVAVGVGDLSYAEDDLLLDQPAVVVFTSGSTGEPKAVLLTLGNLYYSALGSNQNIPFRPGDRWLLSLPLYHVGGLGILFRALIGGGAVVLDNSGHELGESLLRYEITHLSLVSTQLQRLLSSVKQQDLIQRLLTAVLLGGSGIAPELIRRSVECGLPIHTSYGLTEMASQVTATPRTSPLERLYTSGRVLPYREMRLSKSGEIEVRGETSFAGYTNGQCLATPFDSDGWYATGDIGSIDGDGYLTVIGRIDTMFISGGENIYPEEIEWALHLIDGVAEVLVVPVPHREYGFRPCAFVRGDQTLEPESIRDSLREFIPAFKIPDRIYPWPSGIEGSGFKPDRVSLRLLAGRLYTHDH